MSAYIFTGPTLSPEEARTYLDATYLPPVSQGDICRLLSRRPQAIGIIDGYFDHVPAVWHKEILAAMAEGVHVFGASSMGALRAAELEPFGMEGVGRIFQAYRDGSIEDDDEVAIAHGPAESAYRSASEAMVNIRGTLAKAEQEDVISPATRNQLEHIAKQLFYPERSYPSLLEAASRQGVDRAELEKLRAWLPRGRVDQKKEDAIQMLQTMCRRLATNPGPKRVSYSLENSVFWDLARRSAGNAPNDALASSVLEELRLDPPAYARAFRDSLLRFLLLEYARRLGYAASDRDLKAAEEDFCRQNLTGVELDDWLRANKLTRQQFAAHIRERALQNFGRAHAHLESSRRLVDDLRWTREYSALRDRGLDKQRVLAASGLANAGIETTGTTPAALLDWFFERLGPAGPHNVEAYAAVLEFAHQEPEALIRMLVREYNYLHSKNVNPPG